MAFLTASANFFAMHVVLVLLGVDALLEDRVSPGICLTQSLRGLTEVLKHLLLRGGLVRR